MVAVHYLGVEAWPIESRARRGEAAGAERGLALGPGSVRLPANPVSLRAFAVFLAGLLPVLGAPDRGQIAFSVAPAVRQPLDVIEVVFALRQLPACDVAATIVAKENAVLDAIRDALVGMVRDPLRDLPTAKRAVDHGDGHDADSSGKMISAVTRRIVPSGKS